MDQENVVYIHNGVYSAIGNNGMWLESKLMQLVNIMLSKVSHAQKDEDSMFCLIHGKWSQRINMYKNMVIYKLICGTLF
jgi:hypothetical protein